MKHKNQDNFIHSDYFVLAIGLSLGMAVYLLFMGQAMLQAGSAIATGLFYILWGVVHHAREGDFHLKIILEYTLIAGLAVSLLLSLLFRA